MARKETMAEREILQNEKDIHPEYRPVVFMDTTTGYQFLSGSTKRSNETVEFEGETYPLIRVEISSDSHHSTLDVKSSLKQMDAWIVSTKIRSQIIIKDSFGCSFCFLKSTAVSMFQTRTLRKSLR